MTRVLRLILIAIVVLTSQQLALARGQAVAMGNMVMCVGGGFVTIAVDAKGNPTGAPHVCPDGVQAMAFDPGEPGRPIPVGSVTVPRYLALPCTAAPSLHLQTPQARAPPISV